jgi:hypothetical protein
MGVLVFVGATASLGVWVVVDAVLTSLEVTSSMSSKVSGNRLLPVFWLPVGATMGMSGNDG